MSLFLRTVAFLAAVLVVIYGLYGTRDRGEVAWLIVVAVAFVLLVIAIWPRGGTAGYQRSLTQTAVVLFSVFIMISVQLVRIQIVDSDRILAREGVAQDGSVVLNPRRGILSAQVARGRIFSTNGEVIVDTVLGEDGTWQRVYPEPSAGYVVGYYSPLAYGLSGLESTFDEHLRGEKGGNPFNEWMDEILHRPRQGYDLTLSLDLELQRRADELLGDQQGSIVLMDAKTGAIRAMVSKPNYDPAQLYTNVGPNANEQIERATAYWEQLTEPGSSALLQRATQGLYAPGSIFKTITAAAALDSGIAAPDTVYRDEGALIVDGRVIPEENRPDENRVDYTLSEAYGWSLNVVYAQIGLQLGADRMTQYATRFGLGGHIPFDLPTATSQLAREEGFLNNRAALADTAFGQGQLFVTPLQMALMTDAVANGGAIMRPYLVERISDAGGNTLQVRQPEEWKRAISPETAAAMRDIMVRSVEQGWAQSAAIPGAVVGGKTGTAETGDGPPHAWFTGFAGHGEPEYVVAVIVEHGGEGSRTALPIGRDLLQAALERSGS